MMEVKIYKEVRPMHCSPYLWPMLEKIKLTGRWKIVTTNGVHWMHVEQSGLLWNSWIPEHLIQIREVEETVNNCHA